MARSDAIVLGAGIVGVAVALHLAKRGLSVALVDRGDPGLATSYGNAGIIEGNTLFPAAFPSNLKTLLRIAFKRASEANYHFAHLVEVAPWLLAFRRNSAPDRLIATMQAMRPLFARAIAEHEALMAEAGATQYLRHTGWLKLYRSDRGFAATARERAIGAELGLPLRALDTEAARALEPSLAPVFRHAVFWEKAASVSNPLAVTRAYAARFAALGGILLKGDAMTLHRPGPSWRVETAQASDQVLFTIWYFATCGFLGALVVITSETASSSRALFIPLWFVGSTLYWLWTPWFLLHRKLPIRRLLPGAFLGAFVIGGTIGTAPLWMGPTLNRNAEAFGSFGVVITMLAIVLITVTISMVCAVFAPVWEEFGQAENEREAAQAEVAEPQADAAAGAASMGDP